MTETLVAGIDSSTQSTKVLLVRAEDGGVVDQASAPHPNGTEVDPEAWWQALQIAGRGLLDRASAIGIAGQQHGMVALDRAGTVVRDALLWNDLRSAPHIEEVVRHLGGPQACAQAIGSVPPASFTVTKLRWMHDNEPANAERTAAVLLPHDWLTWRLGGCREYTTDHGDASGTGYYSPTARRWLPDVAAWALGSHQPPALPRLAAPNDIVGRTSSGAVVSAGTGDNAGAALGLNLRPGDVVVSIGTSGTAFGISEIPASDATGMVSGFADATGCYLPLVCTINATRVLSTVEALLGVDHDEYASLALSGPAGANGLTMLPYLDGERTPNRPHATGVIRGVTSATTREDFARAAVEALLCSLADAVDALDIPAHCPGDLRPTRRSSRGSRIRRTRCGASSRVGPQRGRPATNLDHSGRSHLHFRHTLLRAAAIRRTPRGHRALAEALIRALGRCQCHRVVASRLQIGTIVTQPWMDSQLAPPARADLLLQQLTLQQKMAQVSCYISWDINETSDFVRQFPDGIGEVSCLETRSAQTLDEVTAFQRRVQAAAMEGSGHDIPAIFHMEGLCGAYLPGATSFPSGLGRAAGWDVDLELQVGEIVGRQERAVGITHTFGPVLDIGRDPRMGRHGETYGEDPTLAAALGVAFTRGVQDQDAAGRRTEAVAKHFVGSHHTEGGIHGAHCNIPDRLLIEVYAKPFQAAISQAGLLGVMPSYNSVAGEPMSSSKRFLTTLLREQMGFTGLVVSDYGAVGNLHSVQRVAPSLAEAGLAALRAGMDVELHVPQGFGPDLLAWFADGHADITLLDRAVREVLTAKFRMGLFENPFAPDAVDRDSSFHSPTDVAVTVQSARESMVLLRNDGVLPLAPGVRKIAVIGCHAATARFFFGGYTHYSMAEGKLAANSSMAGLTTRTDELTTISKTVPGTGIEASDGPKYEELLQQQRPGIRSLLDELRNRLPDSDITWAYGYPIAGNDDSGHEEALALADEADVVILTLGGKHGTASIASMGEGVDATDINLPACQEDLIVKMARLGKPTVGIHVDGRPVSSDAADTHLSALLEAWSPAEAGAQAIVDVLTGAYGPSGRLPVSIARNAGQVPIYYNHPNGSAWHQGESIGFPDYVDAPHTPRYPFGHGLTYTHFDYEDLSLSLHQVESDDTIEITCTISNTGERPGTEIVQLYVRDRYASMSRPVLELAGFQLVDLEPGDSMRVSFALDVSQLAFLDADMRWRVEAGEVDVMIGASSADLRLTDTVRIGFDALVEGKSRAFYAGAGGQS